MNKRTSLSRILFLTLALLVMVWNITTNLLTAHSAQEERGKSIVDALFQQLGLPAPISDESEINFDDHSNEEGVWQYSIIKPYDAVREGMSASGWYGGFLTISRAFINDTNATVLMTCKTMAKVLITNKPDLAGYEINAMQSQAESFPQQSKLDTVTYHNSDIWLLTFDGSGAGGGVDQIAVWQSGNNSFYIRFDSYYQGKGDSYNIIGDQCPFADQQPDFKTWYQTLHDINSADALLNNGPQLTGSKNDPGGLSNLSTEGILWSGMSLTGEFFPPSGSRFLWLGIFLFGSVSIVCVIITLVILLTRR